MIQIPKKKKKTIEVKNHKQRYHTKKGVVWKTKESYDRTIDVTVHSREDVQEQHKQRSPRAVYVDKSKLAKRVETVPVTTKSEKIPFDRLDVKGFDTPTPTTPRAKALDKQYQKHVKKTEKKKTSLDKKKSTIETDVLKYYQKMNVEGLSDIQWKAIPGKYATMSNKGVLTLDPELLDKPKDFRDRIIVHELLHLRYKRHDFMFKESEKRFNLEFFGDTKTATERVTVYRDQKGKVISKEEYERLIELRKQHPKHKKKKEEE